METTRASGANLSRSTDRRGATSRVGYTTMSPAHREESRALHAIAVEFVKKWDEVEKFSSDDVAKRIKRT